MTLNMCATTRAFEVIIMEGGFFFKEEKGSKKGMAARKLKLR